MVSGRTILGQLTSRMGHIGARFRPRFKPRETNHYETRRHPSRNRARVLGLPCRAGSCARAATAFGQFAPFRTAMADLASHADISVGFCAGRDQRGIAETMDRPPVSRPCAGELRIDGDGRFEQPLARGHSLIVEPSITVGDDSSSPWCSDTNGQIANRHNRPNQMPPGEGPLAFSESAGLYEEKILPERTLRTRSAKRFSSIASGLASVATCS